MGTICFRASENVPALYYQGKGREEKADHVKLAEPVEAGSPGIPFCPGEAPPGNAPVRFRLESEPQRAHDHSER